MYNTELIQNSIQKMTIEDGSELLGIVVKNNHVFATSKRVAEIFDKKHYNVLRDIRNIIEKDEEFGALNFEGTYYIDSQGKKHDQYLMNRAGFSMLVFGFTGKKAFEFKKMYIEGFEQMSQFIKERIISKGEYKEMTSAICKHINPDDGRYYAKEADMVNQAVLGMKASQFKKLHNLKDYKPTRDSVAGQKLQELNEAQRMNTRLIEAGYDFETRKDIIEKSFRS